MFRYSRRNKIKTNYFDLLFDIYVSFSIVTIACNFFIQLWIERHQPKTVSDLAVHPKKIDEIKFWFENNVLGKKAVKGKQVKLQSSLISIVLYVIYHTTDNKGWFVNDVMLMHYWSIFNPRCLLIGTIFTYSNIQKCHKIINPSTLRLKTFMSNFQKQDILLLTGPPGCGKTATIKALANNLRISIQEWINPTESSDFVAKSDTRVGFFNPSDDIPYVSQTNSFKTFMLRANRYKVLSGLFENNSDSDQNEFGAKIVLIEELPPFALRKKEDFQEILFQVNFKST